MPLVEQPRENALLLVPALVLVAMLIGAPWLPRRAIAPVAAILVGGIAAFALGGAVVGTSCRRSPPPSRQAARPRPTWRVR